MSHTNNEIQHSIQGTQKVKFISGVSTKNVVRHNFLLRLVVVQLVEWSI